MPFDTSRSQSERVRYAEFQERRKERELDVKFSRWRDYYVGKVRQEGKKVLGCGPEKGKDEQRKMAKYPGKCSVCGGKFLIGDWIFWDSVTRKVRHAPSGWKEGEGTG